MFNRKLAIVTSLLLIFNSIFWFYGEVAAIYMSEAFFASLIAYTSYQVLRGDNKFIYISALVLGMAGGFRQDLVLFMFPLWLFCITHKNLDNKRILVAFIVLAISILLWYLPTMMLTGYETYAMLSKAQFMESISMNSVLFGADITGNLIMILNLLRWSLDGIGILGTIILILFVFYRFRKIFKLSFFKNTKVIFLLLWILPAFFFYLLFFIAKPGYILVYLPAFALVLGCVLLEISSDLSRKFNRSAENYYLFLILFLCLIAGVVQFAFPFSGGVDYGFIHAEDTNLQYINQSLAGFSSGNTLIFMDSQTNWRKTIYYFPDYEIYGYRPHVINNNSNEIILYYNHGKIHQLSSKNLQITIDSSKSKILWLVDYDSEFFKKIQSKIELKSVELPSGQKIYYSDINDKTYFEVYGFVLKRE